MKRWLLVLALVYTAALAADFVAPHDPRAQDRERPFAPPERLRWIDDEGRWHARPFVYPRVPHPSRYGEYVVDRERPLPLTLLPLGAEGRRHLFGVAGGHPVALLGTDRFGRDVLSRLLHGGRISLLAGLAAALLAVGLGTAVGVGAGFAGGRLDRLAMRGGEVFLSLPWLYLLLGVRAFLPLETPPGEAFLLVVLLIGLLAWPRPARLARAVAATVRDGEAVAAARGFGAGRGYLLRRHVLPEALPVASTQAALLVPQVIAAEVTLSFLGLGVAEPLPSWGSMLAALAQVHVLTHAWWLLSPAVAIALVAIACHRLAVALEERSAR